MNHRYLSDKRNPSAINYFNFIVLLTAGIVGIFFGLVDVTTKEADVFRKNQPTVHVTGDAAVHTGLVKLFGGVMLIGGGIYNILGRSSSETAQPSSNKIKNQRRDVGGQRNHRK